MERHVLNAMRVARLMRCMSEHISISAVLVAVACAAAGCATEAPTENVAPSSSALSAACDPSLPFLAAAKLGELGTDTGPATLSSDETTMYLVLGGRLHVAKRARIDQPFSAPAPAPGFGHLVVGGVALTETSSHLHYSLDVGDRYQVFVAPRFGTHPCGGEYCEGRPAGLPHLPIFTVDGGIALGDRGLYVQRGGPVVGGTVVRYDLGTGIETPASRFESHASYGSSAVHRDESRLYMFRSRPALNPWTPMEHEMIFRDDPQSDPWSGPPHVTVTELDDAAKVDVPLWVSRDACRLYFARSYPGDVANQGFFVAERGVTTSTAR